MEESFSHSMDELDKKILNLLQQNARMPFLEVARECNVSGAAIHQRVQKLIEAGIVKGSHIELDPKKIGLNTCAYIGIFLEKAGYYEKVVRELIKIPEIVQCSYTTGNYSMFVKIYARDNEHLKTILAGQIQKIEGIARTETFISLEESINRQLPID